MGTLWTEPSPEPESENVEGVKKLLPGGKYTCFFLSGQDELETENAFCPVLM